MSGVSLYQGSSLFSRLSKNRPLESGYLFCLKLVQHLKTYFSDALSNCLPKVEVNLCVLKKCTNCINVLKRNSYKIICIKNLEMAICRDILRQLFNRLFQLFNLTFIFTWLDSNFPNMIHHSKIWKWPTII